MEERYCAKMVDSLDKRLLDLERRLEALYPKKSYRVAGLDKSGEDFNAIEDALQAIMDDDDQRGVRGFVWTIRRLR